MTDLEIVKKCAEKMGIDVVDVGDRAAFPRESYWVTYKYYDPIQDDAQAMALVKRFRLDIDSGFDSANEIAGWTVYGTSGMASSADLNRAICECVAKLP